MEKEDFVKVYSAGKLYEAELIVGLLDENHIHAYIINKRDSELHIGEVDIFVTAADAENAKKIIADRGK